MVRQDLIVLFAVLVFCAATAHAEEVCGPQDYDSTQQPDFSCRSPDEDVMVPDLAPFDSVALAAGDTFVAEWEGSFVDRNRLIEVGMRVRALRRLRWADRVKLRRQFDIHLEHVRDLSQAQLDYMAAQLDAYRDQLGRANERVGSSQSWWRSPTLWLAIGVVVTAGLVAVSAYGLSAAGG